MQYYKDTPRGRVWFSGTLKLKNGGLMATSSKEILEREGWTPFEPQDPILYLGNDPIPEDVKLKILFEKHPE